MDPLGELLKLITDYRYYFLFPATVIEGPITTVIGGFFVGQGAMKLWQVFAIVVAGDLVGDYLYYLLGRWGRDGFLDRWGKYVGVTRARVKNFEKMFSSMSGRIILISKLAHGIGTVALVTAGAVRMPRLKFLYYNLIGTVPKSLILIGIGYFFGNALVLINGYLDYLAWIFAGLAIVMILVYYLISKYTARIEKKLEE